MSDEVLGRGITVTVKYGKGYEESWAVFRGQADEVREDLEAYFGLDREATAEYTLSELVVHATRIAHAKGNVAGLLGGTIVKGVNQAEPTQPAKAAKADGTDPWVGVEQGSRQAKAEDDPNRAMLDTIAACASGDQLRTLWAENQAAFADPAVMDAWKARGRELK